MSRPFHAGRICLYVMRMMGTDCFDSCSVICLEVVRDDQPAYTMSCTHVFHFECAARWYQRDATRTCPVCRSGLDGDA